MENKQENHNTDSSEEKNLNQNPGQDNNSTQENNAETSSTQDEAAISETPENNEEGTSAGEISELVKDDVSGSSLEEEIHPEKVAEVPEELKETESAESDNAIVNDSTSGTENAAENTTTDTSNAADLSTAGEIPAQETAENDAPEVQNLAEEASSNADEAADEDHHEEETHEDDHHEEEEIDFSSMSKEQLLQYVIASAAHQDERNINKKVQTARGEFNRITKEERQHALESWLAEEEGREEKDFTWEGDEQVREFHNSFKAYKKARQEYINSINKQKDDNLQAKRDIIEKLKHLTEQDENNQSFNEFKKLQDEWRKLGHVPIAEAENIWNSYNHYVDKFFERRSLYTEFKELDRKRNLTAKESVVSRIEALINQEDMNEVMRQLRNLQDEWRHTGPVPKESVEAINQRYKEAVIAIYDKREKLSEELQKRREQNYDAKMALMEKIDEITSFVGEKVQDWMTKNQELGQWIENWRSIGAVPSAKSAEVKERFSAAIRRFNHAKNEFFRNKKKEKVDNLRLKTELAERVEKILEEENIQSHRKEVIKLQDDWKKIGPVPSKYSDKIWKRFQTACDAFFAKVNEKHNAQNQEQYNNLKLKNDVIDKAEGLLKEENIENVEPQIRELQAEFNAIGFVPFKEKDKVRKRFFDVLNELLKKSGGKQKQSGGGGTSRNVEGMSYELQLQNWAQENGGQQRLNDEERKHQRDLKRIENEIATLENNMAFFKNSKTADTFKQSMEKQVEQLRSRMQEIQEKIKLVRSIGRR